MSEQNKAVVLKFIEAMGACDQAAAAPCVAPEAFALAKGFGKFAGSRPFEVMVGMIGTLKQILPTGLRPIIHTVTAEGDRVAVEWEGDARTADGTPYCNQYCMLFVVRDGLIREVNEYFCSVLADRVLWPLIEPTADQISAS
jgi:hypothetical protein